MTRYPIRNPPRHPTRRRFLSTGAAASAGFLAGCLDRAGEDDADGIEDPTDLPQVSDPPDAVYVPTHREGMEHLGPVEAGEYVVGAMVSYAHPFWTITGDAVEPVAVGEDDDVHLMATVWDRETETVVPADEGITMTVLHDGDPVETITPWSMLSQTMGFHFGDNVPLGGDGTYELEIALPPPAIRRTGEYAGRFESFETATLEFTYDQSLREGLVDGIQFVDEEHWGVPGALEPGHGGGEMDGHGDHDEMDGHDPAHESDGADGHHALPVTTLPDPEDLPGTLQHDAEAPPRSGDADVVVSVAESFEDWSPYLIVSPRTPYNAIPLPEMTISVVATRDGDEVASGQCGPTFDDRAGFHYGAGIEGFDGGDLAAGDELVVHVDAPPQVARHQGDETAFVDMESIELTVRGW